MCLSSLREEVWYTDPVLVVKVREKLVEFLSAVPKTLREDSAAGLSDVARGRVDVSSGWWPRRVGVVDGGSNIVSLNAGYLGIVAAMGIVIEDNHVVERIVAEPEIVPPRPEDLAMYETIDQVSSVVDKVREAMVFETACRLLEKDLDLLVVDGPLIPYGALSKIVTGTEYERRALERYRNAVLELHRRSVGGSTSVIGFVKRPRSKYLHRVLSTEPSFDHVLLSRVLREGEFLPDPPRDVPAVAEWFHDVEILELVERIRPRFTFLRLVESSPPYRVDFGYLAHSYRDILSYLYAARTREGIPYIVMKVDEEVKITRKLLRELYEDALHSCITKYLSQGFSKLIPILPEYGGL